MLWSLHRIEVEGIIAKKKKKKTVGASLLRTRSTLSEVAIPLFLYTSINVEYLIVLVFTLKLWLHNGNPT